MNSKYGILEERCKNFARHIRQFSKTLKMNTSNFDDIKQLIRSSGSVGANYLEANNSLGSKDFLMRIRICKKEARESSYWLDLLVENIDNDLQDHCKELSKEAMELAKIFGAISNKFVS